MQDEPLNNSPGPWVFDEDYEMVLGPGRKEIADMFSTNKQDGFLIAAAPSLYTAAREVVDAWRRYNPLERTSIAIRALDSVIEEMEGHDDVD